MLASNGFPYRSIFIENDLAFPGLYLPYWIAERYCSDTVIDASNLDFTRKCVYGALLGYLYIRIQDDVYDHKEDHDVSWLLLGNEFIRECFDVFRGLFPSNMVFWGYFQQVWRDFSQATAWEINTCRKNLHAFQDDELFIIGKKLSFAKVPVTAILIHTDHETDLPIVYEMMDLLAASSQLLNDLWSLERDFKTGHFTYVLSSTVDTVKDIKDDDLCDSVYKKLLQKDSVENLFHHVISYDKRVLALLESYPVTSLYQFAEKRITLVKDIRERYLRMKLRVLFSHNNV